MAGKLARTLRKELKVYLFDWGEIEEESFRFENLITLHLLKAVRLWKAVGERDLRLNYIRDKEKREVDFVISEKEEPLCLVECKAADETLSSNFLYYQKKLSVPVAVQLLHKTGACKKTSKENATQ